MTYKLTHSVIKFHEKCPDGEKCDQTVNGCLIGRCVRYHMAGHPKGDTVENVRISAPAAHLAAEELAKAAQKVLAALETEAKTKMSADIALDNFSNPQPEVDAAGDALIATVQAIGELHAALSAYRNRGKTHGQE